MTDAISFRSGTSAESATPNLGNSAVPQGGEGARVQGKGEVEWGKLTVEGGERRRLGGGGGGGSRSRRLGLRVVHLHVFRHRGGGGGEEEPTRRMCGVVADR
jgi:hypothetical protein